MVGKLALGGVNRKTRAAAGKGYRGLRKAARLTRRAAYFLLPPLVYDLVKGLFPRALQPEVRAKLRAAVGRRIRRRQPEWPAAPEALAAVAVAPPMAAVPRWGLDAGTVYERYHAATRLPENTAREIDHKLARVRALAGEVRFDRVRLLREVARLEQAAGNDLKGCVYRLRAMRLLGRDQYDDLLWVRPTLERHGYEAVAEAAAAMYSWGRPRDADCERLLAAAKARHRPTPRFAPDYTVHDDRRGGVRPRVSVVMTLYNGANKLATFLQALQAQTLNRAGGMELVIVDSCSPTDEYSAFKAAELTFPIPTLFVRTAGRESIQTAWNRGIQLARGPYLSLLGVDEGIAPETLELLAGRLDADPGLDWVQGDMLVTDVDPHGALVHDVMTYDRAGFFQDVVSLETCYMGPVGALYRKSLHDRAGWFDGEYKAAGDTEFKNRVLPDVRVGYEPRMLGLYLNYPEERATASPRAELEDFRAWYLHRTPAGVRAAFAGRPPEALEAQLVAALGYRKSYVRHTSTDFEYADAVATVLAERKPDSAALALAAGVRRGLAALRALDHMPGVRPDAWAKAAADAYAELDAVLADHRAAGVPNPAYEVFNDNRYEQHHAFW